MDESNKTKEQIIKELTEMRTRVAELEKSQTEQMQFKAASKETEETLLALINATRETLLLIDAEGTVLIANEVVAQRLGKSVQELTGACIYDHFPPDVARLRKEQFNRVFLTGRPVQFEDIRGGKSFDTYCFPVFDKTGKASRAAVFACEITERRLADEKLMESEERYRVAIEQSNDGVALLRGDRHIYVNNKFLEIFGFDSPDEVIGKTHDITVYPDDLPMVMEYNRKRQRGEPAPSSYEFRGIRKDGIPIFVGISSAGTIFRGEPVTLAYFRDITENKQAEEALKLSEQKYRELVQNANSIILRMDTMGVITFFNEFSQRFFGYNEAKIIGKNVIGTIVPEYETTGRNLKLLIEDIGRNPEFHINNVNENVCRNGERVWIAWTNKPIYNEDKEVTEILCIGNDITERKQMEKALQESEEQFRKIFEKSSLGMVMAGINLNFIRANEAFCNMLGYTEQELLLLTFKDITHPEHIAEDVIHVNDLISGKIPLYRTEKRYIRKDKGIVWGSSTVNILCDSNDRFLYFLTTVEDITQRKRSEEEKTRLESQLRQAQKTEAIGTLAGGIAHDFNNILTALMGYATLMQMKIDKSSPLKSYVEQILSASRKAADLTQSLLAFSRQQPVILVPLDINNTIKATKKLLKRLLTEDIELQTSLMQDDTIAMADKSQIDQILFNLVTNARDALPKGGTITIETNIAAIDKTFINGHEFVKPGRYVLISVSDTGIGMDEATIDKIFDPFFTTKEVGKGTGLGLATVYGIVKQHNGYITVDSKPNSGTIFHIYLPAVRMKVDDKQDKTTPIATGKEIILIAEDNKEVRYFMREALQQHGYIIIEAADGEDAVDKFKQHRDTDLIVVDSVMPKKNGMEVYKEIHGINPHIKVLFTSGYTKDVVLDKGIEDKEFDFVAKPLLLDRLLQKVREILDRK